MVSVITPCRDGAPFVADTIASVLAQTHPAVEHVVVDDASGDGSWDIIARHAAAHPDRVRAERLRESGGASHARNRGAALARGGLLMFLDADDLLAPSTVETLVDAVRERPDGIAFGDWRRYVREHGDWRTAPPDAALPDADPDAALRGWLEGRTWVPPCAVLWLRATFDRSGGWDESLTLDDDGELMMRALARGVPLLRARGGAPALYRSHDARLSLAHSFHVESHLRSAKRAVDKVGAELERQGRLAAFAESVGTAYHRVALMALQGGHRALAEECLARGEQLGGRSGVSRTAPGRLLARLVGLRRKEKFVQRLARHGLATRSRRAHLELSTRPGGGGDRRGP